MCICVFVDATHHVAAESPSIPSSKDALQDESPDSPDQLHSHSPDSDENKQQQQLPRVFSPEAMHSTFAREYATFIGLVSCTLAGVESLMSSGFFK